MPAVLVQCAPPIAVAQARAALNGTVLSVPSLATFTLPVFTGAMLRAAGMAGSLVAGCTRPAFLAATRATHAHTMCAAVHRTDFIGAIWTCPVGVAGAGTTLLKIGAVARALVRAHCLQDFTVVAAPARVAVALAVDAHAVAGAGWVQAIRFFTVFSFVSRVAGTRAHDANAPAPTLGIDALSCRHITLGALPAAVTQAAPFGVLPIATAQHWAGCSRTIGAQKPWKTMAGSRNTFAITMAISGAFHHRL